MNLMDILRLDLRELETEYRKLASVLEKLGLSDYEARAYVALVVKSHATADELAATSMLPRTSVYKALRTLEKKRYVTATVGRPTTYHPVAVEEIRARTLIELNEMFDKLASIKGMLSEKGTPQLVYTIIDKKRVMAKIGDMIESAKRSIMVSSPAIAEIRGAHAQRFKDAVNRGVKIVMITLPGAKVPESTEVYRKSDLLATDIITDGEMAMIASPDLELCGFSDNPFIAEHLERFMRMAIGKEELNRKEL
jgi:HTH-type transcriptional regulator, sugar sensing transcriptional regulator